MTSTIPPQFTGGAPPPENRRRGGPEPDESGLETTHFPSVPRPGGSPARDAGDATALELQQLRREIAALRSDYARLRAQLPQLGPAAGPDRTPPTQAFGRVDRPQPDPARPAPRPGPAGALGRPAPTPTSAPASARPAPPAALRPTPVRPGRPVPVPRSFDPLANPAPPRPRTAPPAPPRAASPVPPRTAPPAPPRAASPAPPRAAPPAPRRPASPAASPAPPAVPPAPPAAPPAPRAATGRRPAPAPTAARPPLPTQPARPAAAPPAPTPRAPVAPRRPEPVAPRTVALPVVPPRPVPRAPGPTPAPRSAPARGPITNLPPTLRPGPPATTRLPAIAPARPTAPAGNRTTAPTDAPDAGLAAALAGALAEVLKVDRVDPDRHFFDDLGADSLLMAQFCARVRQRPELPTVSIKDVYRNPTVTALARALAPATPAPGKPAPADGVASGLAAVLADVLKIDRVDPDRHFFHDLGADSLLMARFCARLRQRPELPTVSIKDVYRNPTVTALAGAFGAPVSDATGRMVAVRTQPGAAPAGPAAPAPESTPMSRSKPRFFLCGLLQLLWLLAFPLPLAFVAVNGFEWVATSQTLTDIYLRSLMLTGATFAGTCLLPILLKWILIGRWEPRQLRVWSLAYLRFWVVRSLIQLNPLARFVGSPIFSLYLRALGAKIGRGVLIFSPVPVGTDLFTAGAGTVIRKDAVLTGYRVVDGVVQIGPVTLGRDAYVGEMTVLDIGTSMGDGAQLGHSSSLHTGQSIPAGEHWHGSPAEPTTVDYRTVTSTRLSFPRRFLLPLLQLLFLNAVTLPLAVGLPIVVFRQVPQLTSLVAALPPAVLNWTFYRDALLVATVLYAGFLLLGLLLMVTVPRLLRVLVRPDREYRLFGVRYWAHGRISRMTNSRFFVQLLGDSAYIVGYLRSIGYDLSNPVQTGSNFGSDVKHDNPYLSKVGTGTVVADGLSFINSDYSGSHFRVSRVAIGAHNFLGNRIAYPVQGRTGDNCLLATKVMVPMDGPVREGVGLLGSPSFEIPRTVERDQQLDVTDPAELRRQLRRKTRHNTVTILMFLSSGWLLASMITVLTLVAVDLHSQFGALVALASIALLPITTGYLIVQDRLVRGLMVLRPDGCSIYDRAFRRHERFWKLGAARFPQLFNGTPFKCVVWRMLGAKVGKRVFDDGCTFTERRFVSVGDYCTLNAGSIIQCHSQEDGAFKSGRTTLGARTTLGVGAFVHYGVTVGHRVLLEPDSFLMKGSDAPSGSRWGGNPAMEIDSVPIERPATAVRAVREKRNKETRCA